MSEQYKISTIFGLVKTKPYGALVQVVGRIRQVRDQRKAGIIFVDVQDGPKDLKCVASENKYLQLEEKCLEEKCLEEKHSDEEKSTILSFEELAKGSLLTPESCVIVKGRLIKAKEGTTQDFELELHSCQLLSQVPKPYVHRSNKTDLPSLRHDEMKRQRAQIMQNILSLRSKLYHAISCVMFERGILRVDPSPITKSDCEGAGEVIKLDTEILEDVCLAVSVQLPLEGSVLEGLMQGGYTIEKVARGENSITSKHLASFPMLELEACYPSFLQYLVHTEGFVKSIIRRAIDISSDEYAFFDSRLSHACTRGQKEWLIKMCSKPFIQIEHETAIDLIHLIVKSKVKLPQFDSKGKRVTKRQKVKKLPSKTSDLSSDDEKIIVTYFGIVLLLNKDVEESKYKILFTEDELKTLVSEKHIGAFVFVTHWPSSVKSFYMKKIDETDKCEAVDLLVPMVGELLGGSMREDDYNKLCLEMDKRGMKKEDGTYGSLQWYVDLRKEGAVPHGGWGIGFDRLMVLLTGVSSVRDVTPYPVYSGHCKY